MVGFEGGLCFAEGYHRANAGTCCSERHDLVVDNKQNHNPANVDKWIRDNKDSDSAEAVVAVQMVHIHHEGFAVAGRYGNVAVPDDHQQGRGYRYAFAGNCGLIHHHPADYRFVQPAVLYSHSMWCEQHPKPWNSLGKGLLSIAI